MMKSKTLLKVNNDYTISNPIASTNNNFDGIFLPLLTRNFLWQNVDDGVRFLQIHNFKRN